MTDQQTMPALAEPHTHFHHTVSSAIESLTSLGVPQEQIRVRRAGRRAPGPWVIAQTPAPGAPLHGVREYVLDVAELGCFHRLPLGFKWLDEPGVFGSPEILAMFDDVFVLARHARDEGARLFDISPRRPAACERWLRLFGLEPDDWPEERWYAMAVMAASLHAVAGTSLGLRWGLEHLLRMELVSIRFRSDSVALESEQRTLLGPAGPPRVPRWSAFAPVYRAQSGTKFRTLRPVAFSAGRFARLGLDATAGGNFVLPRRCVIRVRLNDMSGYRESGSEAGLRRTASVMRLLLPLHLNYELDRVVGDPSQGSRLARKGESSSADAVLKVTSYLGRFPLPGDAGHEVENDVRALPHRGL